ncbi:hypothetical protein [Algoriphagus sp. CAU 1675]|uniref:hypothetical protein n=1 Tax=Algoriphagus sp. CAU 1675 TaxID=3032597 RepID=UPI0023DC0904|nr:hypothetical protein [Algoriphagus sp. CAU 1675]MDF2156879.1 hypothetical protein [Algoriphagus sp. CAU 1675]
MSQLNQIIASLLSDINEAKSKADEASRNLAQVYAADEILRYFPVPKIGIQNLEVEIRYAIESIDEKPVQNSQSLQRLTVLAQSFAKDTAKAIQISLTKAVSENELYKDLGGGYPSGEWEKNLADALEESLSVVTKIGVDVPKSLLLAQQEITRQISDFIPVAYKSESLAAIPTITGEYQIIGLDKSGKRDFVVSKKYPSQNEALADAKILNASIIAKKTEVGEVKKLPGTQMNLAELKAGNKLFSLEIDSRKVASLQPKDFLEKSILEKGQLLTSSKRIKPVWMGGRLSGARPISRPTGVASNELKEDNSLKILTDKVLKSRIPEFGLAVEKILNENVVTTIQVAVESEKLKQVKPENLATIRFSLNAQDFTMLEDENQKTFL